MRLIDADEMQEELKDMDIVLVKHNVEDWIDEQPTVDAEPVRHGKWIEACFDDGYDSAATCSLCEESTCFYGRCENDLPPFCSKCGADMRGERN